MNQALSRPPILPDSEGLVAEFWQGAMNHQLLLQKCSQCQAFRSPPSPSCPSCHSAEFEWTPSQGRGVVYSFTIAQHPVHEVVQSWTPYNISLIDLSEGVRVVSTVIASDDTVTVGQSVHLDFVEAGEDFVLPVFRPVSPSTV